MTDKIEKDWGRGWNRENHEAREGAQD